ncbi:hypothetical protein Scep_020423 [Stephania cephalantha]|uniref:Uncharacterized protein n=1 Tax=Stephania cephalantha TaxID=152367 RepID=A0AAP0ICK7_9MAGN
MEGFAKPGCITSHAHIPKDMKFSSPKPMGKEWWLMWPVGDLVYSQTPTAYSHVSHSDERCSKFDLILMENSKGGDVDKTSGGQLTRRQAQSPRAGEALAPIAVGPPTTTGGRGEKTFPAYQYIVVICWPRFETN